MMRKFSFLAAAITALGSTVGMAHGASTRFVRDGVAYQYTSEARGDRQIIEGHRIGAGAPFRLVVRNGRVSGRSNGVPVGFNVADAAPVRTVGR